MVPISALGGAIGLHKAAKYYYYPGWHEPGPGLETMINKDAWESLPPDLQMIVETTCQAITTDMVAEYTHGNAYALQQLVDDPDVKETLGMGFVDSLKSVYLGAAALEREAEKVLFSDDYQRYDKFFRSQFLQRRRRRPGTVEGVSPAPLAMSFLSGIV